ncbi:efflux RND transporter periplasmic adaptor subunit [Algisphaera agarilytica]|uniref:RND family efflux transporter MFP subunit n=1 Tax=Algisphaera agarilytica TaxID=1385975 RepID=A0A7X0H3G3_9BACT|nr:efflux RND transporter periplasmic adaptor subunit [Algisphaera agarilytica]MBB6428588.1 RND family efflux transporter MFP subunit [Algisphaera agarilytica]
MSAESNRLLVPAVAIGLAAGIVVGALGVFVAGAVRGQVAAEEAGGPLEMEGSPPASVRVGQVEMQTLQNRVAVVGRLQEVRRVTVTAEVEGKITELAVDEGDRVVGQETKLAQIDEVWAELRLKAATADLAAAQAELDQAQSDLEQLERLSNAGSAKAKEVDDQRTLVAANLARLDAAIADRDRAQTESQRAAIVAPFDGAVSQTLIEVGQWVDPGDGVVEMISIGEIDALVDVPERFVNALNVGDEVEVKIESTGHEVVGQIVSVRPDGTNASRTFPVKIRLPDHDGQLRAGMSVMAQVPISREGEFITVPRDAVLFGGGGAAVWYAAQMGKPEPAALSEPVEVLFGVGDRYAVAPLPGGERPVLSEGTQVVIEGAERLYPTQPLNILNAAADGQASPADPAQPQDTENAVAPDATPGA